MTTSIQTLGLALFIALTGCAADAATDEAESVDVTEEALVETDANLLKNGSFKTGDDWREIPKWTKKVGAGGTAAIYVYSPGGTNGFLAVHGGKEEATTVSQTVAADPRADYVLTFKAATDSTRGTDPEQKVRLEFLDASKRVLATENQRVLVDRTPDEGEPGVGAWWRPFKKNKLTATAPAKTAFVRVTFVGPADPPREFGGPFYAAYESAMLKKL